MAERTIRVDALARVEGEGALYLRVRDGAIEDLRFRIVEPPRFFEALLLGRDHREAPDITSRICGICPVAYMMGAAQAMESALDYPIAPDVEELRRLLYCGEWIESHVLHAAMLHAPDFLGLPDALQIARVRPELVRTALRLKKLGNAILEAVGGRAIHPINFRLGGFYKAPAVEAIARLVPELEWGANAARELALAFAQFDFPALEQDYQFVSLGGGSPLYPIMEGRVVSSRGLDIAVADIPAHFEETQVPHSTALHGRMRDGSRYLLGPLARYATSAERLTPGARDTARACGLGPVVRNPYRSILVRMVEVQYACEEALRLASAYRGLAGPPSEPRRLDGEGVGATEAPRGICVHHYRVADGRITWARIAAPTSQNQPQIEEDLRAVVAGQLHLDDESLRWRCEQTIRNHDPCISCATHFLALTVERV